MKYMHPELQKLPSRVKREILSIIHELLDMGWQISFVRYDARSFGNWHVDLIRPNSDVRVVKDRSQYFATGPAFNVLQKAGLGKSFDDPEQFRQTLAGWATAQASE